MAPTRLQLLQDSRDRLLDAMRECEPRELAALSRELRAVLGEIEKIPGSGEVSELDLIAAGVADFAAAQRRREGNRRPDAASS